MLKTNILPNMSRTKIGNGKGGVIKFDIGGSSKKFVKKSRKLFMS